MTEAKLDGGMRVVVLLIIAVVLGTLTILGLTFWGASVLIWWLVR